MDLQTGIRFGEALQRISHAEADITELAADLEKLTAEFKSARTIIYRGALVVALWIGGLVGHLGAAEAGKVLGTVALKLLKIG